MKVIQARSTHQELARDTGRMAVLVGSQERVEALAAEIGDIAIAALNSPRTFTVAGPTDSIKRLGQAARKKRIVFRQLDLDYPFHCSLIDVVREPLAQELAGLKSSPPTTPFISTVTGRPVVDGAFDADYWWRNVREPVQFAAALGCAADLGARLFIEIGPRSVLLSNITETLEPSGRAIAAIGVLEKTDAPEEGDPIRPAVAAAFVRGASIDIERTFGAEPSGRVALPAYPWQRRDFRITATSEAAGATVRTAWHRLVGARATEDGTEWFSLLDTAAIPELADHRVGGQAILPGAAFIEIALTVARDWFKTETASLLELDIAQPLPLDHDHAKELLARLSPTTNRLEIMSRPRLSRSDWQVHATAKISKGLEEPASVPSVPVGGSVVDAGRIYAAAEAVGLVYGPTFRLATSVSQIDATRLVVALAPSSTARACYRIDPAPLDACFHGLFVLFEELGEGRSGTAYLPVRFGAVRVLQPGASPVRALIQLRKADARSIVADFTLFDEAGEAVAILSEARFQAARVKRVPAFGEHALVIETIRADAGTIGLASEGLRPADILGAIESLGLASSDGAETVEQMLLEGWASAASYEIARGLSAPVITTAFLGALPPHVAPWLLNLLYNLEAAGLATLADDGWHVAPTSDLPASGAILRTIADESPHRSAELLLAASLTALGRDPGALGHGFDPTPSASAISGYELEGASARAASKVLDNLIRSTGVLTRGEVAPRILQIGHGPLSFALNALADETDARLTILETAPGRLELARLALGNRHGVAFAATATDLTEGGYDVVVSAEALHRLAPIVSIDDIRRAAAPGALLVAIEPMPSQFRDLVVGLDPDWFGGAAVEDLPIGPLRSGVEWTRLLDGIGFAEASASPVQTGHDTALLLVARAPDLIAAERCPARSVLIETRDASDDLAVHLGSSLTGAGDQVALRQRGGAADDVTADVVVCLLDAAPGAPDLVALKHACMSLKLCAEACGQSKAELWVVLQAREGQTPLGDPVVAGVTAFSRTLANEYASLKVRRLAIGAAMSPTKAAEAIATIMGARSDETDYILDTDGLRVARVRTPSATASSAVPAGAARLERGATGGLAGLTWSPATPAALDDNSVQIAVAASGLNFRDVMWALSLLPDDVLEDGFAGPSLGLECAGHVTALGRNVTSVAVGDRVVAFAPAAFATSVTVPAAVVARIPDQIDTEAAATIPVAFLTAYYSLVTLGGLKAGQSILIHGGAGGVGLAAIQIAQWCGADVIASAGSPAKRDLLRMLGVTHVLNSRSSAFADAIRETHPAGVDLVLNSLSGEAMERGLSVLKPFGRFIELGKRDYVANTHVGLRPFRRNLSYFGVDVDQLLSDRDRASAVFGEVMGRFAQGVFRPLPYRVFPATETTDAFRLMQRSGHVGKILVQPPTKPVAAAAPPFRIDPAVTHLVTGGYGGFGLEAARWLADRGARHLVLVGRRGADKPEAQALVEALRERGVSVRAAACDVADATALGALLADIRATMPPLGGVMHAAMVLEDSVIANLGERQLERVLAPKVEGARLLDELTRGDPLGYFVLFSSVTTFVGNPGQAAYVAANGYLEGVARRRRESRLPALAVAWARSPMSACSPAMQHSPTSLPSAPA